MSLRNTWPWATVCVNSCISHGIKKVISKWRDNRVDVPLHTWYVPLLLFLFRVVFLARKGCWMLTEYTRNRIATIVVASSDSLIVIISTSCCEFTLPKIILHRILKINAFERPLWCFSLPTLHRNDKNQLNITSLNWKQVYQYRTT